MELLGNPKTEYLLDASLETLHAESREWLNEIAFWNEEMTFFYKLIHLREPHISFPTEGLAGLEKNLIEITSTQLGKLKADVESHERTVGRLVRNSSFGEEREYHDFHRDLLRRMYDQQRIIREFKKNIFSFVK
jgi:hypothetical protein